jgi:hypothetical protein
MTGIQLNGTAPHQKVINNTGNSYPCYMFKCQITLISKIKFSIGLFANKNILQPYTKAPIFIITRLCKEITNNVILSYLKSLRESAFGLQQKFDIKRYKNVNGLTKQLYMFLDNSLTICHSHRCLQWYISGRRSEAN